MATYRTALAVACMVLAMLTTAACQQLNEAINNRDGNRDLKCGAVPADICARLADDIASDWRRNEPDDPSVRFTVETMPCDVDAQPGAARCWFVNATTAPDKVGSSSGTGTVYFQLGDGTLLAADGRAGRELTPAK